MTAVTVNSISAGYNNATVINANFTAVAAAINDCLSKSATSGNQMTSDLDMNGHSIINAVIATVFPTITADLDFNTHKGINVVDGTLATDIATYGQLTTGLATKVDKVTGFGLSSNDYTTTEKSKLAGIEAGAQVNTVSSVNGLTGAVVFDSFSDGTAQLYNVADPTKKARFDISSAPTGTTVVMYVPAASGTLARIADIPTAVGSTDFDQDTLAGVTWNYKAGKIRNDNVITSVAAGSVTLTDNATNYVEVNSSGVVSTNTSGFTSGSIPIRMIVLSAGTATSNTDERAWLNINPSSLANPMTAVGDLILGSTAGTPTRLAIGTSSQVLTSNGTTATWVTPTAYVPPVLPVNAQTGTTYTLALTDAPVVNASQGIVTMNNAAANTLTVPTNATVAFPVGAQIQVTQLGAGQTTIAAAAGATVSTPSTLTARAQYSTLILTQVAADTWILGGDMT